MTRMGVVLGSAGLVLLGVVAGAVLEAVLLPSVRRAGFQRERWAEMRITARDSDPRQWREDSARVAQWQEIRMRASTPRHPREVRRVQALSACVVSFEFRDTTLRDLPLMHVRAWDRRNPGVVVAEGWAYREPGFDKGDTATVVLPNVYCRDLLIGGYGLSAVAPPHRRRYELEVR
ncbi:MAG: hypothetical protein ABR499_00615 [Gemmatimonadaceae bacterium]